MRPKLIKMKKRTKKQRRVTAIIVAAGKGKRFGRPKQFSLLRGRSVLDRCLEKFDTHQKVSEIILVLHEERQKKRYMRRYKKIAAVVKGGRRRQDSVFSGLNRIDPNKADIVLVHDGVRPLVDKDLIERVIDTVCHKGAAIPAIPVEDTVKIVENRRVKKTLERKNLYRIQTPQGFLYKTLSGAMNKARRENFYGTDEASLVERIGKKIYVIPGDSRNIKITTPRDMKIAESLVED